MLLFYGVFFIYMCNFSVIFCINPDLFVLALLDSFAVWLLCFAVSVIFSWHTLLTNIRIIYDRCQRCAVWLGVSLMQIFNVFFISYLIPE
jgi:hypothetical protein